MRLVGNENRIEDKKKLENIQKPLGWLYLGEEHKGGYTQRLPW